jgi:hypothetical protein
MDLSRSVNRNRRERGEKETLNLSFDQTQYEAHRSSVAIIMGHFLPGIVFSKVYKNANLITNRATFSIKPTHTLELILDYFHHRAEELNNIGGIGPLQTLKSRDVGQEVTLTAFHYIGRHFFFQGIASVGIPGEAIEQAVGDSAGNWYTLQASLYMFF